MNATELQTPSDELRRDWLQALDELTGRIETWAADQGWKVHREAKTLSEKHLGEYTTERLEIDTPYGPAGRLVVEPVARAVYGSEGMVDFYAWATRNTVRLLRENGGWRVRTESEIDWPHPWGPETFVELAVGLAQAR
jgi:hypothetical protein